jgi:hypothetical protein
MAPQRPGQRRHPPRIQTLARQADEMIMACSESQIRNIQSEIKRSVVLAPLPRANKSNSSHASGLRQRRPLSYLKRRAAVRIPSSRNELPPPWPWATTRRWNKWRPRMRNHWAVRFPINFTACENRLPSQLSFSDTKCEKC